MRILLVTPFHPMVGGIETGSELLAMEWFKAGHEVVIASPWPCREKPSRTFPFRVLHGVGSGKLIALAREADFVVHCNIRLKSIAPALIWPRKFVATHHGFYWLDREGRRDWRERLKLWIAKRSINITVSKAIEMEIGVRCRIIPAPYNKAVFFRRAAIQRNRDLVFLGRLVSDKGVDVALRALALLKKLGLTPNLTIVGNGPERTPLAGLASALGIQDQVHFTGSIPTAEVACQLNQHHVLIVPSIWKEPFGLVAVEGIACGCVVVGSSGGGLPEAIGHCGLTFPNGDAASLADCLRRLLTNKILMEELRSAGDAHVAKHDPTVVSGEYLKVFASIQERDSH